MSEAKKRPDLLKEMDLDGLVFMQGVLSMNIAAKPDKDRLKELKALSKLVNAEMDIRTKKKP